MSSVYSHCEQQITRVLYKRIHDKQVAFPCKYGSDRGISVKIASLYSYQSHPSYISDLHPDIMRPDLFPVGQPARSKMKSELERSARSSAPCRRYLLSSVRRSHR